jgi:hypothetical protein
MSDLSEAIRLIEGQVVANRARCTIADDGCPDESSLFGTRDGYLNLALALLKFVVAAEEGRCFIADDDHVWEDGIKSACFASAETGRTPRSG